MRVRVDSVCEFYNEPPTYRIVEQSGQPVDCWLPGIENPDPDGPLDRGGFESRSDAQGFALGVDRERALFGLLTGVTVEDIDTERAKLDGSRRAKSDDGQLDLGALLDAVEAPEVIRRRVA